MSQVNIQIEGMSCDGCKNNIETGIKELKGIKQVEVSLEGKYAKVDFDEAIQTVTAIEDVIEERGFDVVK